MHIGSYFLGIMQVVVVANCAVMQVKHRTLQVQAEVDRRTNVCKCDM